MPESRRKTRPSRPPAPPARPFTGFLCSVGLMLLALFPIALNRSPWIDIGAGMLLCGGVSAFFSLRDMIVLGLQRVGRQANRDRVFYHMCAAVMATIGASTFASDDPRLTGGFRWWLLIGLPLSVYLWLFLYNRAMRLVGWCFGRLFDRH